MKRDDRNIIILIGPPGAGKGTQAKFLEQKFDLFHLSTGDMLRAKAEENDALAQELKSVVENGFYASDDLVLKIVHDRIQKPDCAKGVILDGVPRTLRQAQNLSGVLAPLGGVSQAVIEIKIDEDVLIKRITGRSNCNDCQIIYNDFYKKPIEDNLCDVCHKPVHRRKDDKAEKLIKRLDDYHENVDPVLAYYAEQGRLKQVDGMQEPQKVFHDILQLVNA